MKPITYTARQVALYVSFRTFLNPDFAVPALSKQQLRLTACGHMKPGAALLSALKFTEVHGGYTWQPK